MSRARAVFVLALPILVTLVSALQSAEQLANPFGGQPPEYTPDFPEEYDRAVQEVWEGELLGVKRTIALLASEGPAGFVNSLFSIESEKGDTYCLLEPGFSALGKTHFKTRPGVGGCWKISRDGNGTVKYLKNLGGERYGSFECTRSGKRGNCTYTSTTNKRHKFSIKGGIRYY